LSRTQRRVRPQTESFHIYGTGKTGHPWLALYFLGKPILHLNRVALERRPAGRGEGRQGNHFALDTQLKRRPPSPKATTAFKFLDTRLRNWEY
jgi:hypothetical protein